MPPVSKKQARFMRAVASGKLKKPGLSANEAEEYVSGYPTKDLPESAERSKAKGRNLQRGRQMRKARKVK